MSPSSRHSRAPSEESIQFGMDVESIRRNFVRNLFCHRAKFAEVALPNDNYLALAYTVRDRILQRWICSARTYFEQASRTVAYLSAEFLIGPQLGQNLVNLDILEATRQAMNQLGISLDTLLEQEEEPGLGNGGLGRLAACYLDSLSSLEIPAIGYGIRYEFGIFDQEIHDGWQVEVLDRWLRLGYPWEISHPEIAFLVKLGGHTEGYTDVTGRYRVRWLPERVVKGIPNDTPILGYKVNTANMLRLWQAQAFTSLDLQAFNVGDYTRACEEQVHTENITKVLYPNDESEAGKSLRLQQEYFFVSCSLQDMMRIHLQKGRPVECFDEKYAIQLNDTHPALAVAELMRLLVDEHSLGWEQAWGITTRTMGYTNHTLLPEALETWPLPLFRRLLPRHLEIIFEINQRFLATVQAQFPDDEGRVQRMSLIDERGDKRVRMANLACVGSHAVNGVAQIHSDLLKQTVLRDFYDLSPEKFTNITNGVTPRRFLLLANPKLAALISETIGEKWFDDINHLRDLEAYADDADFCERWRQVKHANKQALAANAQHAHGIELLPDTMFDVQVKRIHEYKRQHLNVLHAVALYRRLKRGGDAPPRTIIFGGKAAPGYYTAKLIIKLIHGVAEVVNGDRETNHRLRIAFLPDLNVKNAQRIYPAADLSEQISTAGMEASGTGNMKFAMNGALTIGTLDGANVEIRDEVGAENFFLFGLTVSEVQQRLADGYRPWDIFQQNPDLREALGLIAAGDFSRGDPGLFAPLVRSLLDRDPFLLCADFQSYLDCQARVAEVYSNERDWTRMSILNTARMGKFSSDRAIHEYCDRIWNVGPVKVSIR